MTAQDKTVTVGAAGIPARATAGAEAWYALSVLCLANILNTLDRGIVGFVAEPIRISLGLTDTQLGFINGIGFVLFYVVFGFPIARWADRGVRRTILALGVGLWSVMALLTGLVQSFVQLVAARAGLAVGEATVLPAGLSLITDLFPPGLRMRATSIFQTSPLVGLMIGMPLVGWVVTHHGWRPTMVVLGLPGLLLAVIIYFTFREPARGAFDPPSPPVIRRENILQALAVLGKNRGFVLLALGTAISSLSGFAQSAFVPAYLHRTLGMSHLEIGAIMGPVVGGAAAAGTLAGGFLADALRRRTGGDWLSVMILTVAHTLSAAGTYIFLTADDHQTMITGGALQSFFNMLKTGPFIAIALALAPAHMRAFAATVIGVVAVSVIGAALGPAMVGGLSDLFVTAYGPLSLRYAMVWICGGSVVLSGVIYALALPSIARRDREAAPRLSQDCVAR